MSSSFSVSTCVLLFCIYDAFIDPFYLICILYLASGKVMYLASCFLVVFVSCLVPLVYNNSPCSLSSFHSNPSHLLKVTLKQAAPRDFWDALDVQYSKHQKRAHWPRSKENVF